MVIIKSFLFVSADNKMYCPKESGYCVLSNGTDQNSGVIKVNSLDGDAQGAQEECLKHCHARKDATGCEVIRVTEGVIYIPIPLPKETMFRNTSAGCFRNVEKAKKVRVIVRLKLM